MREIIVGSNPLLLSNNCQAFLGDVELAKLDLPNLLRLSKAKGRASQILCTLTSNPPSRSYSSAIHQLHIQNQLVVSLIDGLAPRTIDSQLSSFRNSFTTTYQLSSMRNKPSEVKLYNCDQICISARSLFCIESRSIEWTGCARRYSNRF